VHEEEDLQGQKCIPDRSDTAPSKSRSLVSSR
jgi:hypothetical protein